MISKEDKKYIEIARKYGLRLGTVKCEIFCLFEEGYKPNEVRYILRDLIFTKNDPLPRNIRRYYQTWKEAQKK
ncbi:hypothetical protein ACFLTZ_02405 [Chloroflexota bacterium]